MGLVESRGHGDGVVQVGEGEPDLRKGSRASRTAWCAFLDFGLFERGDVNGPGVVVVDELLE